MLRHWFVQNLGSFVMKWLEDKWSFGVSEVVRSCEMTRAFEISYTPRVMFDPVSMIMG